MMTEPATNGKLTDAARESFYGAGRVPLHPGYVEQPQNALPALAPRLAVRRTMMLEQVGHSGAVVAAEAG